MKLALYIEMADNATNAEIEDAFMYAAVQARNALDSRGVQKPGDSYALGTGYCCPKLQSAHINRIAPIDQVPVKVYQVRDFGAWQDVPQGVWEHHADTHKRVLYDSTPQETPTKALPE